MFFFPKSIQFDENFGYPSFQIWTELLRTCWMSISFKNWIFVFSQFLVLEPIEVVCRKMGCYEVYMLL